MFCGDCGTKHNDDSKFCGKCGKDLSSENETRITDNSIKFLDEYEKSDLMGILSTVASLLKPMEEMMGDLNNAKMQIAVLNSKLNKAIIWITLWALTAGISTLALYDYSTRYVYIPTENKVLVFLSFFMLFILIIINMSRISKRNEWRITFTQINDKISNYFEEHVNNSIANMIPPDFRYSVALENMANYIRNME